MYQDDESRTDSDGDDESYEDDSEEELERRQRKPEYSYKLVIVGRPESGKTALINRFIKGTFTEAFQSVCPPLFYILFYLIIKLLFVIFS